MISPGRSLSVTDSVGVPAIAPPLTRPTFLTGERFQVFASGGSTSSGRSSPIGVLTFPLRSIWLRTSRPFNHSGPPNKWLNESVLPVTRPACARHAPSVEQARGGPEQRRIESGCVLVRIAAACQRYCGLDRIDSFFIRATGMNRHTSMLSETRTKRSSGSDRSS